MATVQPPRKRRKLTNVNQSDSNHNRNGRPPKISNTKIKNGKNKSKLSNANVDDLMQLIENEPNENIEMHVLEKIIQILKLQITKNNTNHKDYSLYLKLSWAYLRSGQYIDGISYFTQILPQRDHPKFYQAETLKKIINKNQNKKKHKNTNNKNNKNNKNKQNEKEENDQDSDIEIYIKKKDKKCRKRKKKKRKRQKALKQLNEFELNRPRLNKNNIHLSISNISDSESELEILENIPLKYETSIRVNIGLMLCRCGDYEEALRQTFFIRDLYKIEFKNNKNMKYMTYETYIDYIEMLVMYNQKYWYECINKADIIIQHQNIKQCQTLKTKHSNLICKLDNHSLFELYCILGDSYSRIGELNKAQHIFENIILKHIQIACGNKFDFSLKFHWIYEIYLRFLYNNKEFTKGYNLIQQLMASNISYRYNENMVKLCEHFNIEYYFQKINNKTNRLNRLYHFVIDAEYFGNQCRFVNHSSDINNINCIFTARYKYGATSCPSPVEIWLKSTKKIEKNDELLVNYGEKYWKNVQCCSKLRKREKWDDGFVFTHLVLDELVSYLDMKKIIERHHLENELLADKTYPNYIAVKKDKYDGFGAFATKTIKKDTFILRYSGIRKLCTNHDVSKSRYSIEQKF